MAVSQKDISDAVETIIEAAVVDHLAFPKTWTFYSPRSPDEQVKIPSRADPVRFNRGILATSDPEVADGVRAANTGNYFEADLAAPFICETCGLPIMHQRAFVLHTQREHPAHDA